jgi:ATP-dependent exoDNAse (exonuclease V) beta subunit
MTDVEKILEAPDQAARDAKVMLGQPAEDVKTEEPGDQRLWSVTTIIGCLDKPALLYWTAEETAKAAIASLRSLEVRIEEEGQDAVVKWLRDARFRRPKNRLSNASLGTCAHTACERYALTGHRPDLSELAGIIQAEGLTDPLGIHAEAAVISKMLDRFDGWLQHFTPIYDATEVVVYHPIYGYAGQTDAFLRIDGTRFIVDYKTSRDSFDGKGNPKTPYPEVSLQLAAYRYAESAAVWRPRRTERFRRRYYLLSDAERDRAVPVPQVDGGLVIQLTPDHCEAWPVRCDTVIHEAFLYVLEAARWQFETSRDVIATTPLIPGGAP